MFRIWKLKEWLGHSRAPWVVGIGLSILAAIQALHRARQGRGAFLRWEDDFTAFWSGGEIYGVGAEGYPTLPITLLLMSPFRALGTVPGAFAWALFKIGLAWWLVTRALRLAGESGRKLLPLATLAVLLLSFRPLLSDITHGNLNLLVGGAVASAAWCWHKGRDGQAGWWLGIGAALKVTPALGLLYFLYKRNWRALFGLLAGATSCLMLPGVFVGWEYNWHLTEGWWVQMIEPVLAGRPLTLLQTEHINQSLLGVMARWLTDSIAIPASGTRIPEAVSIHLAELAPASFRRVHLLASSALLLFCLWCWPSKSRSRAGPRTLAEFAMLALVMLFLSERSWKHHYVLLAFPVTYLVAQLRWPRAETRFRLAAGGLVLCGLLIGGTGSGVLGSLGSDMAEAYGCFFFAGLCLFLAVGLALRLDVSEPLDSTNDDDP